jgi:hypothetical protein
MSAQERVQILREATPNSWVALSHDETTVVAKGSSYLEAVQQAEHLGEQDPVLIHVPEKWLSMVL